ncbi:SH3 domain-containing protein [Streptomyces albipurpureus]|uniref:SH3 domain-containing protein n=1 Tax=Streptomyces albipurpureus TaxID=2897419 RepID=A0ABT0V350_9ACTN|nr:SH3 domain-containing protein [Streptomyces sp. CWNU-1]MCM2393791.1 SH3 domain-containing protein [Streptomyces sp. CWNU-1]
MALEEVRPETDGTAAGTDDVSQRSATRYPVAPGYRVNVRSGPGTQYEIVRVLQYGARVPINCQKPGEWITGPYGTTNIWDCIANGQFISDAYVQTGSNGYVTIRCS